MNSYPAIMYRVFLGLATYCLPYAPVVGNPTAYPDTETIDKILWFSSSDRVFLVPSPIDHDWLGDSRQPALVFLASMEPFPTFGSIF